MGALAWTGLNVVLFLLIGYAWIKVFQLLRRQVGIGLSLLFLLSLVSFRGREESKPAENLLKSAKPAGQVGNWSTMQHVGLNPNNRLSVLIEGNRDGDNVKPYGLYTTVSGVMLGHDWRPLRGMANGQNGQLAYSVTVLHDWKLLGINVYTTAEEYEGQAPIE
ncbi:hypothetical protein [Hymenobacter actinosclerus]|uniref:Uncharacterized protein n=1 Tax=Hymenobacter actinosclerus TaxID=82805 RepID=A0A1H9ZVL2_9BACT|nr:hypothetical protein [Hymenobacter actinosclerus]SES85744.1 hypothetical protein SAMN04487998_0488 [Hymenobacter actinosclerus]